MSQPTTHPLEELLLAIGRVAPRPWDHKADAQQLGLDPRDVEDHLELLWLEGLIAKSESGRGVELTPLGREVLDDPEALGRLRAGEALAPSQGAVVRNSLHRPITPVVTRLLLAANLAVFAYCVWLAYRANVLSIYLTSRVDNRVLLQVYHPAGAVTALDVIRGDWWRLLTTCFVHAGALHILLNMYTLYAAGRFVEQTWGHGRYLVIYLVSGWAGSCFGLAYSPSIVVGASGALCGILAADGVWIYLNGRHLPRALVRRGRVQFWMNVGLMTFISFLPGISAWGHLAGALAGAATGVVLHFQRFGPLFLRLAAPIALLPLAWYPYEFLQNKRATSRVWRQAEEAVLLTDVRRPMNAAMRAAQQAYREKVKPVTDRAAVRREPEEVAAALEALDRQLDDMAQLQRRIARMPRLRDEEVENARRKALEYLEAREEAYQETRRCLEAGKDWKAADEKRLDELWERLHQRRRAWEELFE